MYFITFRIWQPNGWNEKRGFSVHKVNLPSSPSWIPAWFLFCCSSSKEKGLMNYEWIMNYGLMKTREKSNGFMETKSHSRMLLGRCILNCQNCQRLLFTFQQSSRSGAKVDVTIGILLEHWIKYLHIAFIMTWCYQPSIPYFFPVTLPESTRALRTAPSGCCNIRM